MAFDIGPYLAAGRYIVSSGAAFGAGVGVHAISGVPSADIVSGFDHIFNGLNEIAVGVGILTPVAAGVWGVLASRMSSKVADVKAAAPGVLTDAVKAVAPAVLLDAAADVPGTTQIRTTSALAQATESPKIISMAQPTTAPRAS